MKHFTRRLGLGKVALYTWYRPLGLIKLCVVEGGPIEQWRTERGRREMVGAARRLPTLSEVLNYTQRASVHYLSGEKYWYQTLFCFVSLQRHATFRIDPVVIEDGTFTDATRESLRRVVPWLRFVPVDESEDRLDALLPRHRYPALRERRLVYPHLRKLTDIHIGSDEVRTVLDSDMLFHAPPIAFLAALQARSIIHLRDVGTHYGSPRESLSTLIGRDMLEGVNVGLYALDGRRIDWDAVEHWCGRNAARYGHSYLEEQALTAMLLTLQGSIELSAEDYVVKPRIQRQPNWDAHLHHYVAESKRIYFQAGWRQVATARSAFDIGEYL